MRRLLGLLAVGLLALGCSSTPTTPGSTPAPPNSVSADCAKTMAGFTDAVLEIDSRLNIGMNFSAYSDKVAAARVAYDKLKPSEIDQDCLVGVGKPAEDAMNEYMSAYTLWNDCIGKAGCTQDSIRTELQAHWSKATTLLAEVRKRLP